METDPAKKLFFDYDGSRFYMSRDGVEGTYEKYEVAAATEKQWLDELTQQKLAMIAAAGNWQVIHFLIHHEDYRHLESLLNAEPRGELWEKCAFLEYLLRYVRECGDRGYAEDLIRRGCQQVGKSAESLLRRARSAELSARIQAVVDSATAVRGQQG